MRGEGSLPRLLRVPPSKGHKAKASELLLQIKVKMRISKHNLFTGLAKRAVVCVGLNIYFSIPAQYQPKF